MNRKTLVKYLDVTLVQTLTTLEDVQHHLTDAKQYKYRSVIGPRCWIPMYAAALKGSHVLLGSECCDTNGSDNNHIKCYTATSNIKLGCSEVDMVMNIGYFNSGLDEKVIEDIRSVRKAIGHATLKCAIEVSLFREADAVRAAKLAEQGGADFIKTGTWDAPCPTTLRQVQCLRAALKPQTKLDVAMFDGSLSQLEEMVQAGANCFGVTPERARTLWKEAEP